jgi:hypothetical protein
MSLEQQLAELQRIVQQQHNQLNQLQLGAQQQQVAPVHAPTTLKPTKPDQFTGYAKSNADLWLWQMEKFLSVSRIGEVDRVPYATTYLREAAASWWKAESSKPLDQHGLRSVSVVVDGVQQVLNIESWSGFKALFLARFRPLDAARQARANLHNLRQTGSVQEYSNRFLKELQLIDGMDEASQLSHYIRGLKSNVAIEIEKADLTDLSQAMNMAARIDQLTYRSNRNESSRGQFSGGRGWNQSGSSGQRSVPMELGSLLSQADSNGDVTVSRETLNALFHRSKSNRGGRQNRAGGGQRTPGLSREEFDRLTKEGKCFRCKQPGHLARDCSSTAHSSHQHSALSHAPSSSHSTNMQAQ